jgi:ribosomal protein S18 acetylase RimI-like enzyme
MEIIRLNTQNNSFAKEAARIFYWDDRNDNRVNERFFKDDKNIMYVAVVEGEVVGQIYGYIFERFDMPKKQLFLYSIDVLKSYQKRGIGKALVYKFLDHLNTDDYHKAFVLTNKGNVSAMSLYKSTGGKQIVSDEGEEILFKWIPSI